MRLLDAQFQWRLGLSVQEYRSRRRAFASSESGEALGLL